MNLARAPSSPSFSLPTDDLSTLLHLFAATLAISPALFLDETLREEEFLELMSPSGAGRAQLLGRVPSVFVAYHAVLAAIASCPDGARSIFVQVRVGAACGGALWAWQGRAAKKIRC